MTLNNQHIVITGGAGFIGSHLALSLAKTNTVTVYDNFSSSVISAKDLLRNGVFRVENADILDTKKLEGVLMKTSIVFHLAVACVRLSLGTPRFVHDVNATGTLATLLACRRRTVKRFIYISSSEVYGTARSRKIAEDHPTHPTTVYGMSKYVGELYTNLFYEQYAFPTIIIRPFNTYGPRSHFNGIYGEVIPRFVIRALTGKQPIIFGNGAQKRDFTYISDTIQGIIKAAQTDNLLGDVVNIAYGKEISIAEIAGYVCSLANLPYHPDFLAARPNDVARHSADITKAQRILSFKPTVPIQEGLVHYIDWVKLTYKNPKSLLRLIPQRNW